MFEGLGGTTLHKLLSSASQVSLTKLIIHKEDYPSLWTWGKKHKEM